MSYSKSLLHRIRNNIPIKDIITDILDINHKSNEGQLIFLCPKCSDMHTGINKKVNLARCFRCRKNYNNIDLMMEFKNMDFKKSVNYFIKLLPYYEHKKNIGL